MTQQELEKYLWGAATALRGTIDAGDYKQYIYWPPKKKYGVTPREFHPDIESLFLRKQTQHEQKYGNKFCRTADFQTSNKFVRGNKHKEPG